MGTAGGGGGGGPGGKSFPKCARRAWVGCHRLVYFCTSWEEMAGGADAFLPVSGVFFRKSSVYDPRTGWSKWEGMPPNCFAVVRG